MFYIAEVSRDRQTCQPYAQTRSRWLGHLPENEGRFGLRRVSRLDHSRLGQLQPKIVTFTRPFTYAGENRDATMLLGDIVDQFHDDHGFAYTCASEQPNFSTLQEWLNQVDDLYAGLKHFGRC